MQKPTTQQHTGAIGREEAQTVWQTWISKLKAEYPKHEEPNTFDQKEFASIEDASASVYATILGMQESIFARNPQVFDVYRTEYYRLKSTPWATTKLALSCGAYFRLFQPLMEKIQRVAAANGWT